MKQVMNPSGEMVEVKPEPGSLWISEQEQLRWLYIAQDGNRAVRITIRRETGKVVAVDLEGYIHGKCREVKL